MSETAPSSKVIWRIKDLRLLSFTTEEVKEEIQVDPLKVNFELGFDFRSDSESKLAILNFTAKIYSDEVNKHVLGTIKTKGEFMIKNFDELRENKMGFNPNFIATLAGVVLSSTRGMLVLLSKGSLFESCTLPVINPREFLKIEDAAKS